jgi:outer membrane protein OmpA-like peptidoglycan-associated protein
MQLFYLYGGVDPMKSRLAFLSTIFVLLLTTGCTKDAENSLNEEVAKAKDSVKESVENSKAEAAESVQEGIDEVESSSSEAVDSMNSDIQESMNQSGMISEEPTVPTDESMANEESETIEAPTPNSLNDMTLSTTEDVVNEAEQSFNPSTEEGASMVDSEPTVEPEPEVIIPESQTVHFGSGSDSLQDTAGIDHIASFLKENSDYKATVYGYSDSTGDVLFNIELSQKRADFVKEYLLTLGVSENQVDSRGFGAKDFIADNETSEGRAKNRRVEISITQ